MSKEGFKKQDDLNLAAVKLHIYTGAQGLGQIGFPEERPCKDIMSAYKLSNSLKCV